MGHYDSSYEYDEWRTRNPEAARREDEEHKRKQKERQDQQIKDERKAHEKREHDRWNTRFTYFLGTVEHPEGPFRGTLLEAELHRERMKSLEVLKLTSIDTTQHEFDEEARRKRFNRGY
jgi:hypothetical protein